MAFGMGRSWVCGLACVRGGVPGAGGWDEQVRQPFTPGEACESGIRAVAGGAEEQLHPGDLGYHGPALVQGRGCRWRARDGKDPPSL